MKLNVLNEDKADDDEEFIVKRKAGAAEIAKKAAEKGGYADLTAWHFEAKLPQYDLALRAAKDGKPLEFFEEKVQMLVEKLFENQATQTQAAFQKLMGELEVWGEIYIERRMVTRD